MRYGTKAWIGLGIYLTIVETLAPKGETLSEAVDTWIEKHPGKAIWYTGVFLVAGHLLNLLPPRIDPIHRCFISLSGD